MGHTCILKYISQEIHEIALYNCPVISSIYRSSADHQQSQSNCSSPRRSVHLQLHIRTCQPSCSGLFLPEGWTECGWCPCYSARGSADHLICAGRRWRQLLLQCQQQCGEGHCLQQPYWSVRLDLLIIII